MFLQGLLSDAWSWKLILASLAVTIGLTFPGGYIGGVVNTPSATIKAWCNESAYDHYGIAMNSRELDNLWSAVVSLYFLGGMIGALSGGISDRIGRKRSLVVNGLLLLTSATLSFISEPLNSFEVLIFSRIISGYAVGLLTAILPIYMTEIAPDELKGAMGAIGNSGFAIAVPFAQLFGFHQLLGNPQYWHYLLSLYVPLIFLAASTLRFLPESPRYLYFKGKTEKAMEEIKSLSLSPKSIMAESGNKSESWTVIKILKNKSLRLNLIITLYLMTGQQLSGVATVNNFSVRIFQDAGFSESDAQYACLLTGIINAIFSSISVLILNLYRRRTVLLTSCCLTIISLCLLTLSLVLKELYPWMAYLSILATVLFFISYVSGLSPIAFFVGSELFELGPRSSAMALGTFCNWATSLFVTHTFLELNLLLGPYVFLFYALNLIFMTIFMAFKLPETSLKYVKEYLPTV